MYTTIEEVLEMVFSMWFMPRLYGKHKLGSLVSQDSKIWSRVPWDTKPRITAGKGQQQVSSHHCES
jgi:hypothetical protein